MVSIPRPAGVVFALTPSTNPVATVAFKIILALMTRNAIIISPHPMAKRVCAQAADVMYRSHSQRHVFSPALSFAAGFSGT